MDWPDLAQDRAHKKIFMMLSINIVPPETVLFTTIISNNARTNV
jgi:hypothetical protein